MRRAISEEQKQQRRQALIDTAWRLFREQPYEAVNVRDVAKGAGLAKGTLFLYFRTKEELFLAVQGQQFESWFDEVNEGLARLDPPCPIETIVGLITASLAARPGLTRLFAILHVVLERNIQLDSARAFKGMLRERLRQSGAALERCLPFLGAGEGARLLLQTYALVIGIQHLADPAPIVREVMATDPSLDLFRVDFATDFAAALTTLLHGTQALHKEPS